MHNEVIVYDLSYGTSKYSFQFNSSDINCVERTEVTSLLSCSFAFFNTVIPCHNAEMLYQRMKKSSSL
jgi:hypothetical protein